jgi:transcriptional regulator with XRE-family HTH domain
MAHEPSRLFPALLRHWRGRRGLSQLDLALAADVSARHISFLETGRALPSREMILTLAAALDVPLRDQNEMLRAVGLPEAWSSADAGAMTAPIERAITRMLAQHEPYPMVVMNRRYDLVRSNEGATRMLGRFVAEPQALTPPVNLFQALFDPRLTRPFVVEWERVARQLLSRLHREALADPSNGELAQLVTALLGYPGVPAAWRQPDFSLPSEPTVAVRLRRDALELGFLTTMTVFNAPQNLALEELRIESYFPLDEATARACERW